MKLGAYDYITKAVQAGRDQLIVAKQRSAQAAADETLSERQLETSVASKASWQEPQALEVLTPSGKIAEATPRS